ncbi:MAG: hypothetical protein DMG67_05000 [Acidobacteria bacterium]|nr:MAG: hypothetical protein DMG67_05000 [Acidobacteriota bacterium]
MFFEDILKIRRAAKQGTPRRHREEPRIGVVLWTCGQGGRMALAQDFVSGSDTAKTDRDAPTTAGKTLALRKKARRFLCLRALWLRVVG